MEASTGAAEECRGLDRQVSPSLFHFVCSYLGRTFTYKRPLTHACTLMNDRVCGSPKVRAREDGPRWQEYTHNNPGAALDGAGGAKTFGHTWVPSAYPMRDRPNVSVNLGDDAGAGGSRATVAGGGAAAAAALSRKRVADKRRRKQQQQQQQQQQQRRRGDIQQPNNIDNDDVALSRAGSAMLRRVMLEKQYGVSPEEQAVMDLIDAAPDSYRENYPPAPRHREQENRRQLQLQQQQEPVYFRSLGGIAPTPRDDEAGDGGTVGALPPQQLAGHRQPAGGARRQKRGKGRPMNIVGGYSEIHGGGAGGGVKIGGDGTIPFRTRILDVRM